MSEPRVFHDDGQVALWHGDVRAVLRAMPAESVHMVMTSPPYWSLRDYGIAPSIWAAASSEDRGPSSECEHEFETTTSAHERADGGYSGKTKWQHGATREEMPDAWGGISRAGETCRVCGAWRGALGLEPTPELFIAHMVEVMREVRRVLCKDGTLWLNIGDSYAAGQGGRQSNEGKLPLKVVRTDEAPWNGQRGDTSRITPTRDSGLKPKDMVGIPWALAFALRADGWWLRQDMVDGPDEGDNQGVRTDGEGVHSDLRAGSSNGNEDGLRPGAPQGYGGGAGPGASSGRGRESYERSEGRQPPREPGSAEQASARPVTQATREADRVPALPRANSSVRPCAKCGSDLSVPGSQHTGLVLDPFVGSGTTAMVARQLGRRAVGIDLNPAYLAMAGERIGQPALMLAPVPDEAAMASVVSQMPLYEVPSSEDRVPSGVGE